MINLSKYAKLLLKEGKSDVKSKITDDMRIIMTQSPLKLDINKKYTQRIHFKPSGLWYGFGLEWYYFCETDLPSHLGDYFYKVDIGNTNVLKITNINDFEDFYDKYSVSEYSSSSSLIKSNFIDWTAVAEKYSGIEISPSQPDLRKKHLWYVGWDVASGCIWNLSKVKIKKL